MFGHTCRCEVFSKVRYNSSWCITCGRNTCAPHIEKKQTSVHQTTLPHQPIASHAIHLCVTTGNTFLCNKNHFTPYISLHRMHYTSSHSTPSPPPAEPPDLLSYSPTLSSSFLSSKAHTHMCTHIRAHTHTRAHSHTCTPPPTHTPCSAPDLPKLQPHPCFLLFQPQRHLCTQQ